MKKANISQLKNQLSRYLERVKNGETILVMERNVPVARIQPLSPRGSVGSQEIESRLAHLRKLEAVRMGKRKGVSEILQRPLGGKPAGVLKALIEERGRR